ALAAVGGFVEGAFRAAVDHRPDVAAALIRRGDDHVRIARIENDVCDAGVFAHVEDLVPGFATVRGIVGAAVAAGGPGGALRRHVDHVGVPRVDDDLANVLRLFEADVLPGFAAIVGAVDAVAIADAALAVVLAGADPDDARVLR